MVRPRVTASGLASLTSPTLAQNQWVQPPPSSPSMIRQLPVRSIKEISAPGDARWWYDWISASQTRNYMLKDPLNDWIDAHWHPRSDTVAAMHSSTATVVSSSARDPYNDFQEFIMKKGCDFEERVVAMIKEKIGTQNVLELDLRRDVRLPLSVQRTWDAMMAGIPVIHGGVLHHVPTRTYGITDLLIRSDWLSQIITSPPENVRPTASALRLRDPDQPHSPPAYHYVVIDIKYSALPFCVNGIYLRNSGSFPAYKSQLYLYEQALAHVQGYTTQTAYLLGRGWHIQESRSRDQHTDPLNRLGCINYATWDSSYVERTEECLTWLRECRSPEAKHWNVTTPPLTRPQLYPNMSNSHDYPFHAIKVQLSSNYQDITELWNVGVKHRQRAHDQAIYSWASPRCTTQALGIDTPCTKTILSAMLDINQPHTETYRQGILVLPKVIASTYGQWYETDTLEFAVDFEIVNHILFEFDSEMYRDHASLIFTIGVGWMDPVEKTWLYRHFTVNEMTLMEEERICREFACFILEMSQKYRLGKRPKCYHWSNAEPSFWNQALRRHPLASRSWAQAWQWVDLLALFKKEPIVVRGALGYSLKYIAKALHAHGLIQTTWPKDSSCKDGLSAMLCAVRSSVDAQRRKIPLISDALVQDIIVYNEVDVKVLIEILGYLREHHTGRSEAQVDDSSPPEDLSVRRVWSQVASQRAQDCIRSAPIATRTRSLLRQLLPISHRTRSRCILV